MRTIVSDDPGICLSVSLSVMHARCPNTYERTDVLFGVVMGTQEIWRPHPPRRGMGVRCGLCQITLATCLQYSLIYFMLLRRNKD